MNTWYIYVGSSASKNYQIGKDKKTWGIKKVKDGDPINNMKEGDEVIFYHYITRPKDEYAEIVGFPRIKNVRDFNGILKEISKGKITKPCHYRNVKDIWEDATYPYRFEFKIMQTETHIVLDNQNEKVKQAVLDSLMRQGKPISINFHDQDDNTLEGYKETIKKRERTLNDLTPEKLYTKIISQQNKENQRTNNKYNKKRAKSKRVTVEQFERNAYISVLTKKLANGKCQLCKQKAPFVDADEIPYLETHHIKWLAKGGKDSLENTVALCPNCHRKMHSLDSKEDKKELKKQSKNLLEEFLKSINS